MKRLQVYLEVAYDKLTNWNWDHVLIIAGDERMGKSTLGEHITDWWYTKKYSKCTPEQIQHICLDMKDFVMDLRTLQPGEQITYDEAGELSNLRMMDRFNYAITQAYQVIGGLNVFTVIILPSVFLVNPFFSTRRARGFIQVYKRGSFAYWGKDKLREVIEKNRKYTKKNPWRVMPDFYDHFPMYNGPLHQPYLEKKMRRINGIRDDLFDKLYVQKEKEDNELKWIANAYKVVGVTKSAEIFGVTKATIYNKLKEYNKNRVQEFKVKG